MYNRFVQTKKIQWEGGLGVQVNILRPPREHHDSLYPTNGTEIVPKFTRVDD